MRLILIILLFSVSCGSKEPDIAEDERGNKYVIPPYNARYDEQFIRDRVRFRFCHEGFCCYGTKHQLKASCYSIR